MDRSKIQLLENMPKFVQIAQNLTGNIKQSSLFSSKSATFGQKLPMICWHL